MGSFIYLLTRAVLLICLIAIVYIIVKPEKDLSGPSDIF
jgi:cbb3-type cytochrome oxidase subunit 3